MMRMKTGPKKGGKSMDWRRFVARFRLVAASQSTPASSQVSFDTSRVSFALAAAQDELQSQSNAEERKEQSPSQTLTSSRATSRNVKIAADRAFSLKSGRILLQHETPTRYSYALLDQSWKGSCTFSVYNRESQTLQCLKGKYLFSELPDCYLPTGPILSQIQDEISFLDSRDAFRSLLLAQGDPFLAEHSFSWFFVSTMSYAALSSNRYVFIYEAKNLDCPRQLTLCQEKKGKIHVVNQAECSDAIMLDSIVTLSPTLFCISSFPHFYLFHLDDNNEFNLIDSFSIKMNSGHSLRYNCFDMISAISDHEIIAFAFCNVVVPIYYEPILVKIDVKSKQAHELICPFDLSKDISMLAASPPLFVIEGTHNFYIFDAQEMAFIPLPKPEHCRLQGIMPDKSLLLRHEKGHTISLFTHPCLHEISAFKNARMQEKKREMDDFLPPVLSQIIFDYVGDDVEVKLSSHFSSFYQGKITQKPSLAALEEVKQDWNTFETSKKVSP